MHIDLVLSPRRLIVPATHEDLARIEKFVRPGDLIAAQLYRKPRNGDHHRKFMALCKFVSENHPSLHTVDDVISTLKYVTGHYNLHVLPNGGAFTDLKSISYRVMDENEFTEWSTKARTYIFDEMFPHFTAADRERVWQQVNEWLAWE